MSDAIKSAREVFLHVGTGDVLQPVRTVLRVPGKIAVFGVMPAHVGPVETGSYGVKTVVVDPSNSSRGLETHVGLIAVFDPITGVPQAVMEAGSVTALRTAAASAVATQALASTAAGHVAVIGSGVQARLHLTAMQHVMDVSRATVWSRSRDSAQRLVDWANTELPFPVAVGASVTAATADADVVCTVTSSSQPVLFHTDLRPGTHVNAVGACFPTWHELDVDLVRGSRIVVDVEESARQEAGDLLLAAVDGELPLMVELGAVLRGAAPGRRTPEDITVFESLGFAALDVAAAMSVYERALEQSVGSEFEL